MKKRSILDLSQLDSLSVLDWMNAPPTTHVRMAGMLLTRKQALEFARLGETEGAEAQERFLQKLRRAA